MSTRWRKERSHAQHNEHNDHTLKARTTHMHGTLIFVKEGNCQPLCTEHQVESSKVVSMSTIMHRTLILSGGEFQGGVNVDDYEVRILCPDRCQVKCWSA